MVSTRAGPYTEADNEKRERQFNELMDQQMAEVKALMMDQSLSRAEREAKTSEVNARYSSQMEDSKETMDERSLSDETSPLAKARTIAGGVSVPLKLYGEDVDLRVHIFARCCVYDLSRPLSVWYTPDACLVVEPITSGSQGYDIN